VHFNLLDYIIIALLLLSALAGVHRGFIDIIGGIAGIVVAIMLAIVYYDDCAFYLEGRYGLISLLTDFIRKKAPITALSTDNSVVGLPGSSELFIDLAHYLAYLIILAGCFLLILLVISLIFKLAFKGLSELFSWGVLGGVNKFLGMVLVVAKNLVTIAIIAGIMYPTIKTAAQMGWQGAIVTYKYMQESYLFSDLLNIFGLVKALLGMNS